MPQALDPFISWLSEFMSVAEPTKDKPNYYLTDPTPLLTNADLHSLVSGTGASIWSHIAPAISEAHYEVIIITCFWATSSSQATVAEILRKLSEKALRNGTHRIKVFIGISSLSLCQKLTQTSSLQGWTLSPQKLSRTLGLPYEGEIPGLDLTVKSIFVRPFSVMHPKFIIIDRRMVILPSCNVSWEDWFEVAAIMSGPVVHSFVKFWSSFWLQNYPPFIPELASLPPLKFPPIASVDPNISIVSMSAVLPKPLPQPQPATQQASQTQSIPHSIRYPAVFLPSPHHVNPNFRPYPLASPPYRPTPLNHFLLTQFSAAHDTVFLQTPNITAKPIIAAILEALKRNVAVHIRTAQSLMVLEQLVTAGTTTSHTITGLLEDYDALRAHSDDDLERALPVGKLKIEYFVERQGSLEGEAKQSHAKVTIFDNKIVVLGSGNMDRASWWTSQEVGVGLYGEDAVLSVKTILDKGCKGRLKLRYDSQAPREQALQ